MKYLAHPYLSKQCGQTCLAMITGKTIEEICDDLNNIYTTSIYSDLQEYLEGNGFNTTVTFGSHIKFSDVPDDSIIRLKKPCNGGHFVLKIKSEIYDPAIGIVKEYKNHYKISHYLKFSKKQ